MVEQKIKVINYKKKEMVYIDIKKNKIQIFKQYINMLLSEEMKRFKLFLLLLLFLLNYIFLNKTIFNISLQLIAILTIIQYTLLSLNGKTKELFNQHTQAIYDCISYFVIAKTIFNKIFDIATNKEEFVIFCVFVFFMVIILRFILILED